MNNFIDLDCKATIASTPRVVEAMLTYFDEQSGNAASQSHA
jgi:cysteine sulfinate desulfinase/cysteine desulfurase-like protein